MEVFYINDIEFVRNPVGTDYRQIADELREKYPKMRGMNQ